jgi:hypothetical protein
MKINKIEKGHIHKVYAEHNGMNFSYILEYSYNHLFYEELKKLKQTFFDLGEETWAGVMDKEDVDRFFEESTFFNYEEEVN